MAFTALSLTAALAACGDEESTSTKTDEGGEKELNLLVASEPPSLHPGLASDTTSAAIINNTFEGLMTMVDGEPTLAAAEKYEVSEDGLVYTFTLRDSQWSNGDAVTAGDFAYAWKWALDPVNASEYASILYVIKGAEAFNLGTGSADDLGINVIDDKTIEVTLENPVPYFLELAAFKTFAPIHQATQESNPTWYTEADTIVSNGPYTLTDWVHNGSMTLEKSNTYWDADAVEVDTVNIGMVEAETTQITSFDAEEIDFLGAPFGKVPLDAIDRLKSEDLLNVEDFSGIYWYKLNTTDPVMQNVNIRKALALAIDRQALVKNITKGEEEPALGLVPSSITGFGDDEGYFKDADFAKAKEYLATGLKELGLASPADLDIKLSYNTSEAHNAIAQFVQQGWTKELGINVTLNNAEWQVYLDQLTNLDYQVGRMGWAADYNDAYTFLEMYNSAENGNNDTGWSNAQYAELLKQATVEADAEKRTDLLLQAEAIIMEEMPVIPVYYNTNLYVQHDNVKGMKPDTLGNINLKYVDVE